MLSEIKTKSVLIGSHVKAWRYSDDKERLNKYNGLLLSATYDKLFDAYLISFDDNGKILISKEIEKEIKTLQLSRSTIIKLKPESKIYMSFHRNLFNQKTSKIK